MTRETLIAEIVAEALAEDARWTDSDDREAKAERGEHEGFSLEGFNNFFLEQGAKWDDSIWSEAYNEYLAQKLLTAA